VPSSEVVVETRCGRVRGRISNGIRVFTGIPYAEPPVGPLRFKAPRPSKPWLGEFDATALAATPPQNVDPPLPPVTAMSENCLQLNVWAPRSTGPHPVFVWIYGGGNQTGSINQPVYQGNQFARDGVICVTCNYRVGVLGFLELGAVNGPPEIGSGNNALRDLLLVLQWVADNIASFGGDPRAVTIGGQSAGAWNCSTLISLAAAQGLFQQAIIASGGGDAVYSLDRASEFASLFVAKLGGKQRLMAAPVEDLLKAQLDAESAFSDQFPYRPVIDGTLLESVPLDAVRAGKAKHIRVMIGHTHDEYRTFLSAAEAESKVTQRMLLHFRAEALSPILEAYRSAYPNLSAGDRALRMLGAEFLAMPTLWMAEAQASAGGAAYYYNLRFAIASGPFGTYCPHGIDIPLIFEHIDTAFARNVFGFTPQDFPMAHRVHAAWVSFIKTGRIVDGLSAWPLYDLRQRQCMVIDVESKVVTDAERAERTIWMSCK
jgi:para-nitrobenzyl esterase